MKQYIFTLFIFLSTFSFGESLNDTVFNDVILIKRSDVVTDGRDFLIDIPIYAQKEPLVIVNSDYRIPLKLFFQRQSFLYEQNEIFLIEYGNRHRASSETEKIAPSITIYHINRTSSATFKIDSTEISTDERPIKFNFKDFTLKENEVKYYYVRYLESKSAYDYKSEFGILDSLNALYNIDEGSFVIYTEKKGGIVPFASYHTLSAVPLRMKLLAIKALEKTLRFKDNDHLKDFDFSPKIYLPEVYNKM